MSNKNLDIFHNSFRSNHHFLEKGENNWPTERILYQLSYEHAEDSPITKQTEKYFNDVVKCKMNKNENNVKKRT